VIREGDQTYGFARATPERKAVSHLSIEFSPIIIFEHFHELRRDYLWIIDVKNREVCMRYRNLIKSLKTNCLEKGCNVQYIY
jgi:hypothetical protein